MLALRERHGEAFERYFRAVPALIPMVHPYPEGASAGWSSDRMLRNREHWMVIGVLAISLGVAVFPLLSQTPCRA